MEIMIDHGLIDIKQKKEEKLSILLQLEILDLMKNMMLLQKNYIKFISMIKVIML